MACIKFMCVGRGAVTRITLALIAVAVLVTSQGIFLPNIRFSSILPIYD